MSRPETFGMTLVRLYCFSYTLYYFEHLQSPTCRIWSVWSSRLIQYANIAVSPHRWS